MQEVESHSRKKSPAPRAGRYEGRLWTLDFGLWTRGRVGGVKYAELHCASAFSFLEGASQPEDLVDRAAELGLGAVALVDRNGLSGAPRFFKAATRGRHQAPRRRRNRPR